MTQSAAELFAERLTLEQLQGQAQRAINAGGSLGAQIAARGDVILVFDGTAPPTTRQLVFTDLVGQPSVT